MITTSQFILYVDDQRTSRDFYSAVLEKAPRLDAPGMTEFELGDGAILGLMPKAGIVRLLRESIADAMVPDGQLRAELYLMVDDPTAYHGRALRAGAQNLSDLSPRDWGHRAAYCLDPDGHVLAFASEL
jgi:predicted enzyme related to lactoylglutathione lyase